MDSNPYLSDILRHGLILWFNGTIYEPTSVPLRFRTLVQEQNSIGWNHLFSGRLSQEWRRHHDIHLANNTSTDPNKSGAQWCRSAATHFLQRWLQLWQLRNNSRHGKDPVAKSIALRAQVLRELTQLYSLRLDVLPRDQALFYPTVEAHIAAHKSTSVIRNWLSTHRTLIVLSSKEAACLAVQGFRSLTTYYQPAPTQKPTTTPLILLPQRVPLAPPWQSRPARVGPS
jgi:hypothetical protein